MPSLNEVHKPLLGALILKAHLTITYSNARLDSLSRL
jgi:hypothetical protein